MRIPGAHHAVVDPFKVLNYLLSAEHTIGRHKALFFATLGYRRNRWQDLMNALVRHADEDTAVVVEETIFGAKYAIVAPMTGPNGQTSIIVTVWIVRTEETFPRLVTAYPRRLR
jgi:hypothetical protein